MNKPELSIIIVEYNSSRYLADCLKSIEDNLKVSHEIIVVDNNERRGTRDEGLEPDKFSLRASCSILRTTSNLGFGGACNLGAEKAVGSYLLFLNPDTLLTDDSITRMVEFLKSHQNIGIICPKILTGKNGPAERDYYGDFPTLKTLITRNNHHRVIGRSVSGGTQPTYEVGAGYLEVERVTGAAMMMKKELFNKADGFDPKFFMYFEDTDLCKKVCDLGYRNAVFPASSIIHFGGKTQKSNKTKKKTYYTSQDYFFKKHYGTAKMYLMKSVRFFYRQLQF